jgi:predicted amidohydrolase YtcJ
MEQVVDAVDWAFANGIQLITHANGDGATDMLIAAIGAAAKTHGPGARSGGCARAA